MADKKIVFIAFAMKDKNLRDLLRGQSLSTASPFEFVDMSVKDPYKTEWKKRVGTRIKRSHGVLAIVTKNSPNSAGQEWEIQCAKEEKTKLRGFWGYKGDRTDLAGVNTYVWNWENIASWIDSL